MDLKTLTKHHTCKNKISHFSIGSVNPSQTPPLEEHNLSFSVDLSWVPPLEGQNQLLVNNISSWFTLFQSSNISKQQLGIISRRFKLDLGILYMSPGKFSIISGFYQQFLLFLVPPYIILALDQPNTPLFQLCDCCKHFPITICFVCADRTAIGLCERQ